MNIALWLARSAERYPQQAAIAHGTQVCATTRNLLNALRVRPTGCRPKVYSPATA